MCDRPHVAAATYDGAVDLGNPRLARPGYCSTSLSTCATSWKVDTRAHGGYVVGAGSRLAGPAGGTYRRLRDLPPAPLPPLRVPAPFRAAVAAAALDHGRRR